jgi:hypothetical protein
MFRKLISKDERKYWICCCFFFKSLSRVNFWCRYTHGHSHSNRWFEIIWCNNANKLINCLKLFDVTSRINYLKLFDVPTRINCLKLFDATTRINSLKLFDVPTQITCLKLFDVTARTKLFKNFRRSSPGGSSNVSGAEATNSSDFFFAHFDSAKKIYEGCVTFCSILRKKFTMDAPLSVGLQRLSSADVPLTKLWRKMRLVCVQADLPAMQSSLTHKTNSVTSSGTGQWDLSAVDDERND